MNRTRSAHEVEALLDGYTSHEGLSGGVIVHVIDKTAFVVLVRRGDDLTYEAAMPPADGGYWRTVPGFLPAEGRA